MTPLPFSYVHVAIFFLHFVWLKKKERQWNVLSSRIFHCRQRTWEFLHSILKPEQKQKKKDIRLYRNKCDSVAIVSTAICWLCAHRYSYLGRKRLKHENETWVEGSEQLVNVEYSYWTLSYILSKRGAEKLLRGEPFGHLVPVDEYLPIMFDRHPESRWKEPFPNRDLKVELFINLFLICFFQHFINSINANGGWGILKAYSVAPLMVYPTHYTGEAGYISDTESSEIVPDIIKNAAAKEGKADKGSKEVEIEDKIQIELPAMGETGPIVDATSTSAATQREEIATISNEFHVEL